AAVKGLFQYERRGVHRYESSGNDGPVTPIIVRDASPMRWQTHGLPPPAHRPLEPPCRHGGERNRSLPKLFQNNTFVPGARLSSRFSVFPPPRMGSAVNF